MNHTKNESRGSTDNKVSTHRKENEVTSINYHDPSGRGSSIMQNLKDIDIAHQAMKSDILPLNLELDGNTKSGRLNNNEGLIP